MSSTDVVGYTHSDGYCLCVKHATTTRWSEALEEFVTEEMKDSGNESGHVQPIFNGDEWDTAPHCDVCLSEAMANGTDTKNAIIEGVTIIGDADEEEEEEDDSDEDSNPAVPLSVIEEFVRSQRNIEFVEKINAHTSYKFTDGSDASLALGAMSLGNDTYSVTVDPSIQQLWDEDVARWQTSLRDEARDIIEQLGYNGFSMDKKVWYCVHHAIEVLFDDKWKDLVEFCTGSSTDLRDPNGEQVHAWTNATEPVTFCAVGNCPTQISPEKDDGPDDTQYMQGVRFPSRGMVPEWKRWEQYQQDIGHEDWEVPEDWDGQND